MNNPSNHPNDLDAFSCLDRFNSLFNHEAQPRASSPLTPQNIKLLHELAEGNITPDRRQSAINLLTANTQAMELLSQLLKDPNSQSTPTN